MGRIIPRLRRLGPVYLLAALLSSRRIAIKGWSMYPCLAPGEYVLFDRLAYRGNLPRRGEVVLAFSSHEPGRPLVKRIVGLPGETVTLRSGQVYVNGRRLKEGYVKQPDGDTKGSCTLRAGEYYLLGDARSMSTDSRTFGPVPGSMIKARAWLVYWPPGRWRRVRRYSYGAP